MPEIRLRDSAGVLQRKIDAETSGNERRLNASDVVLGFVYPMAIGSATGTGSQQTIAHGMGVTPTHVFVSPTSAIDAVAKIPHQSAAPDSTSIFITAGNEITYNWIAVYKQ